MAIEIKADGVVVVRAPRRVQPGLIAGFVKRHADWIALKQAEITQRPRAEPKGFVEGEDFLFLGQTCRLHFVEAGVPKIDFNGHIQLPRAKESQARDLIEDWYRAQARKVITQNIEQRVSEMGCRPSGLRITGARQRWGSCGIRGALNFNWRLVMAPPDIIDYIVVHEMAHLKFRGHGRQFWKFVEQFVPRYQEKRQWLSDNSVRMAI
ncbi:SprT family zinc-dependent metalloprotease [Dehalogenimonas sp. 4OHTPN]|uniref:SprT family zinc-dependent metalloprotease n=1 Tax=Dehalogenimonas sp. 4OHTPN TaxID=3166643 RepID=A0AAU8GAE1_9CHLR